MDRIILERLEHLEQLIRDQGVWMKDILTIEELSQYTGYATSYLYRFTSEKKIPFYKPYGKLYFRKTEINEWMLSNRNITVEELEEAAQNFTLKSKR